MYTLLAGVSPGVTMNLSLDSESESIMISFQIPFSFFWNLWTGSASKNSLATKASKPEDAIGTWSMSLYQETGMPCFDTSGTFDTFDTTDGSLPSRVERVCFWTWVKRGETSTRWREVSCLVRLTWDTTREMSDARVPRPGPSSMILNGFGHPTRCHSLMSQTASSWERRDAGLDQDWFWFWLVLILILVGFNWF